MAQKLQALVDETIRGILKVSVDTVLTLTSYSAEALLENYKHFKIFETVKVVFISKITVQLEINFRPPLNHTEASLINILNRSRAIGPFKRRPLYRHVLFWNTLLHILGNSVPCS